MNAVVAQSLAVMTRVLAAAEMLGRQNKLNRVTWVASLVSLTQTHVVPKEVQLNSSSLMQAVMLLQVVARP
jgi:hypothetical protein